MLVSIVVPCYNSSVTIKELCERVDKALIDHQYELILVNDYSPDNGKTWNEIVVNAENNNNIIGIDLQKNVGQFASIMCGLNASKGSFIITMDDDLQQHPEDIPAMISSIQNREDIDCYIGKYKNKKHGIIRNIGSKLVSKMYEISAQKPKNLKMGSFRIMRRKLVNSILEHKTKKPIIGPLLLQSTSRIENIEVNHSRRKNGTSGYNPLKLITATLDNLFDSTTLPIRIFSLMGIAISLLSIVVGIKYLLNYYLYGGLVQGFTTTVLLITFFGGMTLFGLGLIGQYIDRIVIEVKGGPIWAERERVGFNDDKK